VTITQHHRFEQLQVDDINAAQRHTNDQAKDDAATMTLLPPPSYARGVHFFLPYYQFHRTLAQNIFK
jgi:oligoendopeptidase F